MRFFKHAFRGIFTAVMSERNMKIHLAAVVLVFTAAFVFNAGAWDWITLVFACAIVTAAEMFNTAIERMCDKVDPDECPFIKDVKDIAAGAVLVCAIAAVAVGIIVFWRLVF
ncbi:MAG: diacylglycerol kinase family protein [Oscillospiraceae bacterium]|nr:diacylglycerol kinase family protein [Oscillospiraceae bacterium]